MTKKEKERLAKLFALLSSNYDGEVVNAVRGIEAILKKHSLSFEDLLNHGLGTSEVKSEEPEEAIKQDKRAGTRSSYTASKEPRSKTEPRSKPPTGGFFDRYQDLPRKQRILAQIFGFLTALSLLSLQGLVFALCLNISLILAPKTKFIRLFLFFMSLCSAYFAFQSFVDFTFEASFALLLLSMVFMVLTGVSLWLSVLKPGLRRLKIYRV